VISTLLDTAIAGEDSAKPCDGSLDRHSVVAARFTGDSMDDASQLSPDERELTLRYAATCRVCNTALPPRSRAIWNRRSKTARCLTCPVPAQPAPPSVESVESVPTADFGVAGASAQRLFAAKEVRRKERLRRNWWAIAIMAVVCAMTTGFVAHRLHANIGLWAAVGAVLPVLDLIRRPQHIDAWRSGAEGERVVGKMLDKLVSQGVVAIHDRRVPGRNTNIDHIAIAPSGIFVVDTKNVAGKVVASRSGLRVAGRRQDKMLAGVAGQIAVVRGVLHGTGGPQVEVRGVLCFTKADLPWLRPKPNGIALLYPRGLRRVLTTGDAVLTPEQVNELATQLATRLPAA